MRPPLLLSLPHGWKASDTTILQDTASLFKVRRPQCANVAPRRSLAPPRVS